MGELIRNRLRTIVVSNDEVDDEACYDIAVEGERFDVMCKTPSDVGVEGLVNFLFVCV